MHARSTLFDDFIAAAEYLIAQGYTTRPAGDRRRPRNGGLLVGAALTQRPELFGAACQRWRDGHAGGSTSSPSAGPGDGIRLGGQRGAISLSLQVLTVPQPAPGHRLSRDARHHADHDDRVVPGHSFKFAAALQAAQAGPAPVLPYRDQGGHGAGKPTSKIIEEAADRWRSSCRISTWPPTCPDRETRPHAKVACSLCNTIVDRAHAGEPEQPRAGARGDDQARAAGVGGKRGVCNACREQYRAKKFLGYLEDEYTKISEMEKSLVTQIARRGRVSKAGAPENSK